MITNDAFASRIVEGYNPTEILSLFLLSLYLSTSDFRGKRIFIVRRSVREETKFPALSICHQKRVKKKLAALALNRRGRGHGASARAYSDAMFASPPGNQLNGLHRVYAVFSAAV